MTGGTPVSGPGNTTCSCRGPLGLAAALLLGLATVAAPAGVGEYLERVAEAQRGISTLRTRFTQRKHLSIVRDVLESSGTLLIDRDGGLVWSVEKPEAIRVVIRPDGAFVDGRPMGAANLPASFLGRIGSVLTGISPGLERDFIVALEAGDRLRLVPRDETFAARVRAIEVTLDPGRKVPTRLRIEEASGDSSEIDLSAIEVNPRLGEGALEP